MKSTKQNQLGATPGKLALVGMLAAVLGMVIVKQLPQHESHQQGATTAHKRFHHEKNRPEKNSEVTIPAQKQNAWPSGDLAVALVNNPFQLPTWAATKPRITAERPAGQLAKLQQQGASIVVIGTEQKSATIGEQRVHVGDILEGYQITDITSQGVVLNKLNPR